MEGFLDLDIFRGVPEKEQGDREPMIKCDPYMHLNAELSVTIKINPKLTKKKAPAFIAQVFMKPVLYGFISSSRTVSNCWETCTT